MSDKIKVIYKQGEWHAYLVIPDKEYHIYSCPRVFSRSEIMFSDAESKKLYREFCESKGQDWVDYFFSEQDGFEILCEQIKEDYGENTQIVTDEI